MGRLVCDRGAVVLSKDVAKWDSDSDIGNYLIRGHSWLP